MRIIWYIPQLIHLVNQLRKKKQTIKRKDYILVPLSAIGAWYPAEVAIANHHMMSTYYNTPPCSGHVVPLYRCNK
jgi:hypothetical protein